MLVTNIERQKRNPQRANVYLDGEFAFGVHVELLAALGLRKGDTLDKEAIEDILSKEEFSLAKNYSLRYLSRRRRTVKELSDKLIQKEFSPQTIDTVIAHLFELKLLNDVEFSKAFVHDIQLRKPSGQRLLRQKLRLKGVPPTVIDEVLSEVVSEKDEENLAMKEAQKLIKRYKTSRKAVEQQKQQQRLAQHLARRGFRWATIMPVVKKIFGSHTGGGTS
jgi:regulatory protein